MTLGIPDPLGAAQFDEWSAYKVSGRGCNLRKIGHTESTRSSINGKKIAQVYVEAVILESD